MNCQSIQLQLTTDLPPPSLLWGFGAGHACMLVCVCVWWVKGLDESEDYSIQAY